MPQSFTQENISWPKGCMQSWNKFRKKKHMNEISCWSLFGEIKSWRSYSWLKCHHHHLFWSSFLHHAKLGLNICPISSPSIYPWILPTQAADQANYVFCQKPTSSLPAPANTFHSRQPSPPYLCKTTPNLGNHPLLRSRFPIPNHLNLPCLTTSATHWTPRRLHKSSLHFLSFKDTPHIHLTIVFSLFRFSGFIAQVNK